MILDERLPQELQKTRQELYDAGELLSHDRLAQSYAAFRERFGPDRLKNLDGEALLETMHDHSNHDSLVYWLEFKNDEEFPAIFGSIAGGSALKLGIYRRKETGVWMTGSPHKQVERSVEEAVQIARKHRDQLVRGAALLEGLPLDGSDEDYRRLQEQMDSVAPDVSNTAWGHKYFSLIYPDKLEHYHVEDYQRFYLIKLLQLPPEGKGRYLTGGRYAAIARELDIPLDHLTQTLTHRDGRPYRYWRIGTTLDEEKSCWELLRDENCVAIGWADLGNLAPITYNRESKEQIRQAMQAHYPSVPQVIGRKTQEVFNFVVVVSEGDLVLPADGKRILGMGRVIGPYTFEPESKAHHRIPVEWLSLEGWSLPVTEGLQTTVHQIRDVRNQIEVERQILYAPPIQPPEPPIDTVKPPRPVRLSGIPGRIQSVLERKKQVIVYGPPGTGKTYWARIAALDLASYASFGQPFSALSDDRKRLVCEGGGSNAALVRMCTFHPAYGYEDFIEGYHPKEVNGQLAFERQDGIFKKLCDDARKKPDQRFYLIVDEINRGDVPRIFGELLTLLEKDKRGQSVLLPLSGEPFQVPDNVYVIGTMNTADRSIALLDTALRRRFGFIELMPDSSVLGNTVVENAIPLGPWLDALNERILEHIGRDARNLQIGHAYLLEDGRPVVDFARFARIVEDDILPLLEEYCYEDYATLEKILGNGLVDAARQRIRHELFAPGRRDDLIQALLAPSPELSASSQAVASEAERVEETSEEDADQESDEGVPA